ncbi:hypothetical protein KIPB_014657, partial [Kipferlia bialata]
HFMCGGALYYNKSKVLPWIGTQLRRDQHTLLRVLRWSVLLVMLCLCVTRESPGVTISAITWFVITLWGKRLQRVLEHRVCQ